MSLKERFKLERLSRLVAACILWMPTLTARADSSDNTPTPAAPSPGCIFFDEFSTTTLDPEKWIISQNVTVDSGSIAPPSPPYAMRLNSNDFIISHVMNLSGFIGAELHYSLERRSNFSGSALVFDYTTAADGWAELTRHTIATPVTSSFQSFVVYLPAAAIHENFHIRIRFSGSFGDTWYLDNFCVMETVVQPPIASSADVGILINNPAAITLQGVDPNLDPIAYIITSLPTDGTLADQEAGSISTVPYTLVNGGNSVLYTPATDFVGINSFHFKVNDGGNPPDGGDSNIADINVTVQDCRPEPAIDPSPADTATNASSNPVLTWGPVTTTLPPGTLPDFCETPQVLVGSSPIFFAVSNTNLATSSPTDPFMGCGNQNSNTLWYEITPALTSSMHIQTCGSNYDTVVTVWSGTCASLNFVGCDDDGCGGGGPSDLTVPVQAGVRYMIEIADWSSPGGGQLFVNISGVQTACSTPNTYTLLLDNANPPTTPVCEHSTDLQCDPGPAVRSGKTYYWRVQSENCCGETLGPVWSFTTDTPADFDHDGDVDQSDFAHLQHCLNGAGIPQNDPTCLDARLDLNDTVDNADVAVFLLCANGPGFPPLAGCGD